MIRGRADACDSGRLLSATTSGRFKVLSCSSSPFPESDSVIFDDISDTATANNPTTPVRHPPRNTCAEHVKTIESAIENGHWGTDGGQTHYYVAKKTKKDLDFTSKSLFSTGARKEN